MPEIGTGTDLARFDDLGPELEIGLHYSAGFGWSGWAAVQIGEDDIRKELADMETDDLNTFLDMLYYQLAEAVRSRNREITEAEAQSLGQYNIHNG